MKRTNFVRLTVPLIVSSLFSIQAPVFAAPDCDLTPDAPICGGENPPKKLYKRLYLQRYTNAQDYVDFYYNQETGNLSWTGKTYLGCFTYKQSYVVPRIHAGTKRRVRFNREFLLPPSWSQLCGSGWNSTITTTGSVYLPLSQIQQDDFVNMFESNDTFIGQG